MNTYNRITEGVRRLNRLVKAHIKARSPKGYQKNKAGVGSIFGKPTHPAQPPEKQKEITAAMLQAGEKLIRRRQKGDTK